ncbi:VOC family protein [Psychrobium sp. 1_MG-2023]|uniref:VOC family protein n=1 Tax=Psychrobium sp. 1_MG-2023 TaxID=3062624 RepID=UPI000C33885F|nr:VOC family protein [Psychrobium sp. 1_MG-2023]MDP2562615.1 VOC family protein [Psychrobium sp. 1_MG-2023]PKF54372.1 VOC family protein [Alteromonadales bacterium alter-6D02]
MNNYPEGQFCWIELNAQNWQVAKDFYSQLFNWQAVDQPIGDDMFYTMMQLNGKTVAAMYQMMPEHAEQGVKTHWLSYIAVDDVDASIAKAKTLNAEIVIGPHNVMNAGRMAVIHEPDGAYFAIWQGQENAGIELRDVNNTLCWSELASKDSAKSKTFYHDLLNWQYTDKDVEGMSYCEVTAGETSHAGLMEMTSEWGEIPPHWMPYFAVESCDDIVAKAQFLGATICVPTTEIPGIGRFSVINDPQKATFSVIELNE